MYPTIETKELTKYSKRRFRSKRLRKKQVSTLRDAYHRLSKKHQCWMASASVTGEIPDAEWWMFCISMLARTMEIANMDDSEFYKPYENDDTPTRQYEKLTGIGMPVEQKTESA